MQTRFSFFLCLATLIGCAPKPALTDYSQQINSGVNILPQAVLAAEKQTPSNRPTGGEEDDLVQVIENSDEPHYMLVKVLRLSGLVPMLQEVGPYTILAPTDDAFGKLPPGVMDRLFLPSHHQELVNFAKLHLVNGRIDSDAMIHTDGQVPTLAGPKIVIKGIGKKVMVQDTNVLRSESTAVNGAIHWIDGVLIPPA
jgi:uncharacterized surface protein with fasciclin (FAS1) repeats